MGLPALSQLSRTRARDRLVTSGYIVVLIWLVFLAEWLSWGWLGNWKSLLGLTPRTLSGAVGIVTMHWVHANLYHLLANTLSLVPLLGVLALTRRQYDLISLSIALTGGSLLWLVGRPQTHVGASLLIFGLMTFHLAAGFFERRPLSVGIALVVGILYSTTLLFGILPIQVSREISWDGHLCGAVAGCLIAYQFRQTEGSSRTANPTGQSD